MIEKISNRTLIILTVIFGVICFSWYLFFSEFYRMTYALLGLTLVFVLFLILKNRLNLWCFIRKELSAKKLNTFLTVIMILALVSAVNYIASNNEYRVDLTRNKINTLSDQTIKVLQNLEDNIHYLAFIDKLSQGSYFKNLMNKYKYYSNKISYEIIDPNREPLKARSYNISNYGTVIATKGKEQTRLDLISEQALSNAIIKLTRTEKKQIYFLTGHQERDIDSDDPDSYSELRDLIIGQGYLVDKINLMKTGTMPKKADLLIIAGPKRKFLKGEVDIIIDYIKKGGPVLVLSDPSMPMDKIEPRDNVNKLLSKFGILMNNDVIVDPGARLFGLTDAMPVVQDYDSSSRITADFNEPTIYPFAQSIDSSRVDINKYNVYKFCNSSTSSWGELDSKSGNISFNKGRDQKGPLSICLNLIEQKEKGVNIVAFGNSSFVSNKYFSHVANTDIFMNSVSFLLKDDDLLAIRPSSDDAGKINLPSSPVFALLSVYIIPFSVLIFGLIYWYRRRRK
jgi:ABC-type uncharacterized transport system involved in gliding motility auxiliary subunit